MKRKFITEEANSSKEFLDMCPYLGKSYHVSLVSGCLYSWSQFQITVWLSLSFEASVTLKISHVTYKYVTEGPKGLSP